MRSSSVTEESATGFSSKRLAQAHELLRASGELGHGEHVAWLAGRLFDAAKSLHGLGPAARELLVCAALVHDVGVSVSFQGHHKHSRDMILGAELPAFTDRQRKIIASLARYHRKALPSPEHTFLAELRPADQPLVTKLAALLRVADGLDREHGHVVKEVRLVQTGDAEWTLYLSSPWSLATAIWAAERKRDGFETAYGVKLLIVEQPNARVIAPQSEL